MVEYMLGAVGKTDVPVACGRTDAGPGANPVPDDWRANAEGGFGLPIETSGADDTTGDAATLIAGAVHQSPSAPTLVALGPWTNLEDAIAADETLPDRLAAIHAMAGTIDAPGNVLVNGLTEDSGLEWNVGADPAAAIAVIGTDVPITLITLDATDDVPVPGDLADRLAGDPTSGGTAVALQLLQGDPDRVGPGQYLWDELAALTVTNPDLASWEDLSLAITADGPEAGRLRPDDAGRPVTVAISADRDAVVDALVRALRAEAPTAT
jgi:inosine-uridine nucleoside N-ribohydrolase